MSHLKGLILLCLINIIVLACSKGLEVDTKSVSAPFSDYYFAIKNPTYEDAIMLRNYMNIYDPPVNYEAAVLLAGYYMKTHEYDKAINLLSRYLEKIKENEFLSIIGTMWLYASLASKNDIRAEDIYIRLNTYKRSVEYNNALKAFCISISEPVYVGNHNCLERMREKNNQKVINSVKNDDEYVVKPLKKEENRKINGPMRILINKTNTGVTLMNGALLALYTLGPDFDVSTVADYNTKYSYIIDRENNEYYLENENKIDFSWNFNNALKLFYLYNYNQFSEVVAIVVKDDFYKNAAYLKDLFKKDREHSIRTIIYTEYGFQDDLEGLLNKYGNSITIITIGLEKDIIDFMPLIRYVFEYKVPVYAIIECFSGLFLEKYYIDYFNNSNIYAFTDFVSDKNRSFYNKYRDFYNDKPQADALIGYDIIQYISYIHGYGNEKPEYLSGIISIDEESNKVLRQIKYYYIRNNLLQYYEELNSSTN